MADEDLPVCIVCGHYFILAKCSIRKTDSDIATALRAIVVLLFSWLMVFAVGSFDTITQMSARSMLFLILSGIATVASRLCCFKAPIVSMFRLSIHPSQI